jgi:anti-sigma factor RsiW
MTDELEATEIETDAEIAHKRAFIHAYLKQRVEAALVAHAVQKVAELGQAPITPAQFAVQVAALGKVLMLEMKVGPQPVSINGTIVHAGDKVIISQSPVPAKGGSK